MVKRDGRARLLPAATFREVLERMDETRVQLVGGPLDGWPILIRGTPPEELRLPYSREMLEVAGRPTSAEAREEWRRVQFPAEDEALGIGVYLRAAETEVSGHSGVLRYRIVPFRVTRLTWQMKCVAGVDPPRPNCVFTYSAPADRPQDFGRQSRWGRTAVGGHSVIHTGFRSPTPATRRRSFFKILVDSRQLYQYY
jgi:hypothetical protein